jgi:hypothetical protein
MNAPPSDWETSPGSTWGEAVRSFLEAHPNETFTVEEVHAKVGGNKGTIAVNLGALSLHRDECRRLPGSRYRWIPDTRLDDAEAALQLICEQLDSMRYLAGEQLAVLQARRTKGPMP